MSFLSRNSWLVVLGMVVVCSFTILCEGSDLEITKTFWRGVNDGDDYLNMIYAQISAL